MRACWSLIQEILGENQSRAARTRALSGSRGPWAWRGVWEGAAERTGIAKRITQTRARFTVGLQGHSLLNCVQPRRRGRKLPHRRDRKSTRLNSSHQIISYAVFCLKKKYPLRT